NIFTQGSVHGTGRKYPRTHQKMKRSGDRRRALAPSVAHKQKPTNKFVGFCLYYIFRIKEYIKNILLVSKIE
ncbi:MAG TPA: hypothetical protein DIS59_03480, partial [Candidatus Magasanikbacteria bacterium]|nr:hypothetical protein [Candidatus Magasanikbacteria bacterium]